MIGLLLVLWPINAPSTGSAALGFAIGGGLSLLLFVAGSLGGGDVKLLAALGLLLGAQLIIDVLLLTAIIGCAMSLLLIVWRGRVGEALRGFAWLIVTLAYPKMMPEVPLTNLTLPVGVAIGVATLVTLYLPAWRLTPVMGWGF